MSIAVNTVLKDFKPTRLQAAAIRQIRKFRDELAQYGLQVRSAMELEFTVIDENGIPQPNALNLDKAEQYIANLRDEGLPHIQEFKTEGVEGFPKPDIAKQYEVTIDDTKGFSALKQGKIGFRPEEVAAITLFTKKNIIPKMLESTTCLYSNDYKTKKIHASFAPNPHTSLPKEQQDPKQPTNALHINVSLIDQTGRNIMAHSRNLTYLCADSLMQIQNQATLAFLPSSQSLERINANGCAPAGLGIKVEKWFRDRYSSVCIRGFHADKTHSGENLRLENRLSGADADPFVGLAVTIAALVDAVRKTKIIKAADGKMSMTVPPTPLDLTKKIEIPKTHQAILERFEAAQHLKNLLGEELYTEILKSTKSQTQISH